MSRSRTSFRQHIVSLSILLIWAQTAPAAFPSWLLRSGDLGVTSCTFHGRFQNSTLVLYTFLTACSSPTKPSELFVSGIFFLYNPLAARIEAQITSADEYRVWASSGDALSLRSPRTGKSWPMHMVPVYKGPGRMYANLSLDAVDQRFQEFYLIAKPNFLTFCSFDVGAIRSPPWPHLPISQPALGGQQCNWLPGAVGTPPKHSYMIMSPFFGLNVQQYATLLIHHMRYHERLGINRYLVYVENRISALSAEPRVQALVRAGKLRIVVLDTLPHFFRDPTQKPPLRHPYAWQSFTYNHALLALWHEDAVAAIADLDEYLFTSKRSLQQIIDECPTPEQRSGVVAVHITRRDGHYTGCCTVGKDSSIQPAKLDFHELRSAHVLERSIWLENKSTADTMPHPIALYGISTFDLPKTSIKSAFIMHRTAYVDPHRAWPMLGLRYWNTTADCAFWLHLRSQVALRFPVFGNFTDPQEIPTSFLWPLQELVQQKRLLRAKYNKS